MPDAVDAARAAFEARRWREALSHYDAASAQRPLTAADLERQATAAYLAGKDDACVRAWEAAYRASEAAGDLGDAARYGFWLAFSLMMRGQMAPAGGWLGRAQELVANRECAATGYLLVPQVLQALDRGDPDDAREKAQRAVELGERFSEPDLVAFGTLGEGQALIAGGETADGTAVLDRVMVSVTTGELGPIVAGIVYCAVIIECIKLLDLQRAAQWTEALTRWCDEQPDLVPYRGQCLVHRSQVQQTAGEWTQAASTAAAARVQLTNPPHPALGLAHYQEGEMHRLRGETQDAAAAYASASRFGHEPMPGLALLDLARGDTDAATAAIRRALDEPDHPSGRAALLAAAVEIARAAGDVSATRAAADELSALAGQSPVLEAVAAQATGTASIAEGDPRSALSDLRKAAATWRAVPIPYEAARTDVLIGIACSMLGDRTSARLGFENARASFEALGAEPDLHRLDKLTTGLADEGPQKGPLSPRELEVLKLVAAGRTNREIGTDLVISQHTVGRHLENIFSKLGVPSRAAATAHAYEHGLI